MSYAQQSYYKDVEWIEESQRMIDYANERWNVIEEKDELIANISGNDYLESVIKKYTDEKYRKISKEIKDSHIRITQYKNEGEYELEYMVYNEKKNKTIKKIIIKQKKKEELMENCIL